MGLQERQQELAQVNFKALCETLNEIDRKYDKKENELFLHFTVGEGDETIHITAAVFDDMRKLSIVGPMFKVSKGGNEIDDQMVEVAIAVCAVNSGLNVGSFILDFGSGTLKFRLDYHYFNNVLEKHIISSLISLTVQLVAQYRPLFEELIIGEIGIEDFLEDIDKL